MKTLIIHPKDPSTDFLSPIYAPIMTKTVVKGGITKSGLHRFIETHDRVIMLGHGAPFGLLNPGQFPDAGLFIIDGSMTELLTTKSNCIFIWCHADQFLTRYGLSGLCSGMFISEMGESDMYGFDNIDIAMINQSNETFSFIMSKYINEPIDVLYQSLLKEYEVVARSNPIARFNIERLYLLSDGINQSLIKEAV
ncbi:MAG: hypothetical protein JXR56_05865 [Candidatus Cloacimonetes bacterium]|nr:hypothetical protein [Candidatus Cloacimonadota bacterium]